MLPRYLPRAGRAAAGPQYARILARTAGSGNSRKSGSAAKGRAQALDGAGEVAHASSMQETDGAASPSEDSARADPAPGRLAPIDLRDFVAQVERLIATHNLGRPGAYCRWRLPSDKCDHDLGLNPYGCADAANLLHTIGRFPDDDAARKGFIGELTALQNPESGLYTDRTHHAYHCTAHCTAALELFDRRPRHRLAALDPLLSRAGIESFLDGLDWLRDPWNMSHRGAGVFASLVLTGAVSPEWQDWYFAWLRGQADPASGLWLRSCIPPDAPPASAPLFHHLAGSFHYLFNHEYARRPLPYPQSMIDTCLHIRRQRLHPTLGTAVGFSEIDWVYCLTRALRQCGHRFAECQDALVEFAREYTAFLLRLDVARHPDCDDLHSLFGACCALAELQQAVPGLIRTDRPLRLVLDRRPFI